MKTKNFTKAAISLAAASVLLIGAGLSAVAETIEAPVTHNIPKTMNIGDKIGGWGSKIDDKIKVTGLENYNGYTFSAITEGTALENDPMGGVASVFDSAVVVENGAAEICLFMGPMTAKTEGTFTIRPYILKNPNNGGGVYTVESLADDLYLQLQTEDDSKYDGCLESAKAQCTYVGEPIVITVGKNGGDGGQETAVEQKKASLKKITEGKNYEKTKYTSDSYKAYSEALEKAKQVLNNANATIEEIETAEKELNKAIAGLKAVDNSAKSPKTGDTFSYAVFVLLMCSMTAIVYSAEKLKA